jgi:autotransporter-associated beta strand protein
VWQSGSGNLTLTGNNTYTGTTTTNGGTWLIAGSAMAFGSGALNDGGGVNLNGFNVAVANLQGGGQVSTMAPMPRSPSMVRAVVAQFSVV